jgi:hypothetical protein
MMQRLHDCVSNPLMAALAQLDSWLDARTMAAQQPKSSAELAALHGRLKKLRCTVAHLPYGHLEKSQPLLQLGEYRVDLADQT